MPKEISLRTKIEMGGVGGEKITVGVFFFCKRNILLN